MTKTATIRMKMPSLNDYIRICRANRFAAAGLKKETEEEIIESIKDLPRFEEPVEINFLWTEANKRRDYDNIAFAKKFVLDALVKSGKLQNDDRKHVTGFSDDFRTGDEYSCTITIKTAKKAK